jgi:hypothetical protein
LAAPSITNKGSIEAPGGQVILAAAQDKVYLQLAGTDSNINGLLVEVGTGGDVNNLGRVVAERGNASLIGFAVNQQGLASASTSVRINGSVRLLAREGIQNPTTTSGILRPASTQRSQELDDGLGTSATVNLAPNSVTRVALDSDKSQTAIDSQPQLRSNIEISGHKVFLREHSTVEAHSGKVSISAVDDPTRPTDRGTARVYLDSGSHIDVSGISNVSKAMESNMVSIKLLNNELRDSPLQRTGVLHGATVTFDQRDVKNGHLPIADVSAALALLARNIDERSTTGGTVTLQSTGDVITKTGSMIDVSGGSLAYQDGYINTTKLADAQGRLYDIDHAPPNLIYAGITKLFEHVTGAQGVFEKGYVQGAAAGSINIAAFEAEIDGVLKGNVVNGDLQRLPSEQAAGGSLLIDLANGSLASKQNVVFAHDPAVLNVGPNDPLPRNPLSQTDPAALTLNTQQLKQSGLQNIKLVTNGSVSLGQGEQLTLPAGSTLDLSGIGFDIQGQIIDHAGTVLMQPSVAGLSGGISLGSSAVIDVSGQWVNDWADNNSGRSLSAVAIDGGTVSLLARQADLHLASGSRIDASGGAWVKGNRSVTAGHGGSISLSAATTVPGAPSSSLLLDGEVSAWGLRQGGSLHLDGPSVVIGSTAQPAADGKPLVPHHF